LGLKRGGDGKLEREEFSKASPVAAYEKRNERIDNEKAKLNQSKLCH